ncbi:MAG TPA: hypothetical protein VJH04_02705 [archaeon]|nr:hypothetical protein [archaeon]
MAIPCPPTQEDAKTEEAIRRYKEIGTGMGHVNSILHLVPADNYPKLVEEWAEAEKIYVGLGYRPVALHDFVMAGGYGVDIDYLLRRKRGRSEPVFFHAALHLATVKRRTESEIRA